jgi:hypothetical protein
VSATIHLQGIGTVPAIQLTEVNAGDTLLWNQGATTEVVSIAQVTPKTIEFTIRSKNGELFTGRKRAATLVARVAR